jgi:hypothetical protein
VICKSGRSQQVSNLRSLVTDLRKCGSALAALALLSSPIDGNAVGFTVGTPGDRWGALAATLGAGESFVNARNNAGIGQVDRPDIRKRCGCALQLQAVAALGLSVRINDRLAAIGAGDAGQRAALGLHD